MFQIVQFQKILEGQCLNKNRLTAPLYNLLALIACMQKVNKQKSIYTLDLIWNVIRVRVDNSGMKMFTNLLTEI